LAEKYGRQDLEGQHAAATCNSRDANSNNRSLAMVRISGTEGHEQQTSATERMPAIARRPTTAGTLTKTGTLQRQMYQQHWGVEACKSRFAIKKARDTYNGKDALNIEDISTSRTPGTVQRHTTYIVKPERKKQEENQQQHGYQQE
jgi:hypothetical protein